MPVGWFNALTGLDDDAPAHVRTHYAVVGPTLVSRRDARRLRAGVLTTPNLHQLRLDTADLIGAGGPLTARQIVAEAGALHSDPANAGALFQVASQFNLLEMISPDVTPDDGISQYEYDRTQGPACAMACGAGTMYRNYFVPVFAPGLAPGLAPGGPHVGQSAQHQLDMAADLHAALGGGLWEMRNGYLLPTEAQLAEVAARLTPDMAALLRIGVQSGTGVTGTDHTVAQAYCSAVPIAYSGIAPAHWEPLARLVLEASYEACLHAALLNTALTGNSTVFLTLIGGGAFGNPEGWIAAAIAGALARFKSSGLDVRIVNYSEPNAAVAAMLARIG